MKKVFVFLAEGFEEMEAVGTIDILRRGEADVTTISITGKREVTGAKGIPVVADRLFEESELTQGDMLMLPGGLPGSTNLNSHKPLKNLITTYVRQGKYVAAICAAPLVFGGLGILQGKKAICYPGVEHLLKGAIIEDLPVVCDGNIVTGKGPGLVYDFGLKLVSLLNGQAKADEVAAAMLYRA